MFEGEGSAIYAMALFMREGLAGQDDVLVLRGLSDDGAVELEVRFGHLVWHARDPLVE